MQVACELCKKVFKVNDGKISSRGSTIHCPRCKHPHLVKRVVDPYPIDQQFKKPGTQDVSRRMIAPKGIPDPGITLEMEATGHLQLKQTETPPPTGARAEKPQYRWKEFLKSKKKTRTALSLGRGAGIAWDRLLFYVAVIVLLLGYIYHQSLPIPEQKSRIDAMKGMLESASKALDSLIKNINKINML